MDVEEAPIILRSKDVIVAGDDKVCCDHHGNQTCLSAIQSYLQSLDDDERLFFSKTDFRNICKLDGIHGRNFLVAYHDTNKDDQTQTEQTYYRFASKEEKKKFIHDLYVRCQQQAVISDTKGEESVTSVTMRDTTEADPDLEAAYASPANKVGQPPQSTPSASTLSTNNVINKEQDSSNKRCPKKIWITVLILSICVVLALVVALTVVGVKLQDSGSTVSPYAKDLIEQGSSVLSSEVPGNMGSTTPETQDLIPSSPPAEDQEGSTTTNSADSDASSITDESYNVQTQVQVELQNCNAVLLTCDNENVQYDPVDWGVLKVGETAEKDAENVLMLVSVAGGEAIVEFRSNMHISDGRCCSATLYTAVDRSVNDLNWDGWALYQCSCILGYSTLSYFFSVRTRVVKQ